MLNGEAPTLTRQESQIFESDPALQEKVKQSLIRFLDFLELRLVRDDDQIVIIPQHDNLPWWLRSFNHTMLQNCGREPQPEGSRVV